MSDNSRAVPEKLIEDINNRVMYHFEEICKVVPRGSKKEEAICKFLENFVKELKEKKGIDLKLERQSESREGKPVNNIVITKPAIKEFIGKKDVKKVALQAHLDMVCQKVDGSEHNFDTMPIITEIKETADKGRLMTSKGKETTLGADDGIGIACIMAVLESQELSHPEIQAIFTSDEEDGMRGARWLNPKMVNVDCLINIDAETEGVLFYGCAGGIYANMNIPVEFQNIPDDMVLYKLEISGLSGGHSGMMIDKGYANANRLMGRALNYLIQDFMKTNDDFFLADISGGDAKNAITTKAVVVIAVKKNLTEKLEKKKTEIENIFKYEYASLEEELKVNVSECKDLYEKVMTKETLDKIVTVIMTVPNGVIDMHTKIKGLVETSSNLGVVAFNGGFVSLICFIRSSVESKKLFVVEQMRIIAEKAGASFVADTDCPEWNPDTNSKLVNLFAKTYKNIFDGKELTCMSIHAGLECGYFFKHFLNPETQKSIDSVAIGPTIDDVHIPRETLHLDTVKPVVRLLLNVLANMEDYDN